MGRIKKTAAMKAPEASAYRIPASLKEKIKAFRNRANSEGDEVNYTDVVISAIDLLTYEQFRKTRKKKKDFSGKLEQIA